MASDPRNAQDPPVSRVLTDRIRADSEMVEQVLDPDRTSENVRYPDPAIPGDAAGTAPDSIAGMKMARRTDAGLRQAFGKLGGSAPSSLLWLAAAVVALVVLAFVLM